MQKVIEYFRSLGVDANTTATILITLFVFIAGLFFTWLARNIKKFKERSSYKKSLLLILTDFAKSCGTQSKVVKHSLDNSSLGSGNDFIIKFVPIGTIEYLKNLDFNTFIQNFEPILFKKNYSKAISKLFELIAQIKIQNESAKETISYFTSDYRKHERQFYENVDALRKIHDGLAFHLDGQTLNKEEGAFVQGYFKIFGDWQKSGANTDIQSEYDHIVLKVRELNKSHPKIQMTNETTEFVLKSEIAYMNVTKIDKFLMTKFKDFAHSHRRAEMLLKEIIKILK